MSDSKTKLAKPANPTTWIEPTCKHIIANIKKTRDMLMESARGPVDIDRQIVFCHDEQHKQQIETTLRSKGYVEVSPNRWERK